MARWGWKKLVPTLEQALARVAELEKALEHCIYARASDVASLQRLWGVTASQAYVLSALYRSHQALTPGELDTLVPTIHVHRRKDDEFRAVKTMHVHVFNIRKRCGSKTILSPYKGGYVLGNAARAEIDKALAA